MFSSINTVLICFTVIVIHFGTCAIDIPQPPSLTIYTPTGDPDYTDVIVKRVNDNLTLVCELQGDVSPRVYVWNFVGGDRRAQPFQVHETGPTPSSTLTKQGLQLSDSGHYMCSVPPFSVSKYILVQTRGPQQCARGAFWCGAHCVLAAYVCDGFRDCLRGEDEAPALCDTQPCARPDKLNCSSGRCVPEAACCRARGARGPLCRQPACCDEHPRYSRLEGLDAEYPQLFEDRHAPDDYGFIQSTIYTVTACALIFMIAVVLLVSAICKMHMKRAALRSYTRAHNHTSQHYSVHYAQAHRFPPCYEASRLLEQGRTSPPVAGATAPSPGASPTHQPLQCTPECPNDGVSPDVAEQTGAECPSSGFGLARLSAMFTSRYRQVPTQCLDVEMTDVRSASLQSSPTRNQTRTRLDNYRSPTYCDLNADFIFTNPDTPDCGRDLNYMATPVEFYRRRTLRGNLDRVLDNLNRPRPLTLQLGRFQLSIPRLGRRASLDRRPDTPNVAELNIDELDFVRLNSNETYTLNGRTIRLLGANFENYPILNGSATRPPPYTEAMRYKLYGPPPEYLSRDGLNDRDSNTVSPEQQARNNIEMPPNYEELASGVNNNVTVNDNGNGNVSSSVTENAINNNTSENNVVSNEASNNTNNVTGTQVTAINNTNNVTGTQVTALNNTNNATDTQITAEINASNGNEDVPLSNAMETLNSVIDNLPAIDSDVNANDNDIRVVN